MLDKIIFAQNIAMLAEIYDRSLTKTLQSVYYAVLQDMQDDDFKQAVKRLLQERVFATFPKPAEILSLSNVKKVDVVVTDEVETKAKELISACETMNTILCTEAHGKNMSFDDYIVTHNFNNICDETKAILNSVKPYCGYVQLIKSIRQYQDSQVQLRAFMQAIKYSEKEPLAINSGIKKLLT